MYEKIKTAFLFLLIALSLFLSGRLWFGTEQYDIADDPVSHKIDFGEAPEIFRQMTPGKIIYKTRTFSYEDEDNNEIKKFAWKEGENGYEKIWGELKEKLTVALENEDILVEKVEEENNKEKDRLIFEFSFFPLEFNERVINAGMSPYEEIDDFNPGNLEILFDDDKNISGIFLNDYENRRGELVFDYDESLFVDKLEDNKLLKDRDDLIEISKNDIEKIMDSKEINKIISQELGGLDDVININQINESLIFGNVENFDKKEITYEKLEKEKLAKVFFHDLSFVRNIEEWDGAQFFTDGQKGLRFFPDGGIEYNAPYKDSVLKDNLIKEKNFKEVIDRGGELGSLYGGWVDGLNLKSLKMIRQGYGFEDSTFELSYEYKHRGFPIVNMDALKLNFNFQDLIDYRRKIPEKVESIGSGKDQAGEEEIKRILEKWFKKRVFKEVENKIENEDNLDEEEFKIDFNLDNISQGFYLEEKPTANSDLLLPVLVIDEKGPKRYVYDIYEAELLEVLVVK